jgi:hypothetical protein
MVDKQPIGRPFVNKIDQIPESPAEIAKTIFHAADKKAVKKKPVKRKPN